MVGCGGTREGKHVHLFVTAVGLIGNLFQSKILKQNVKKKKKTVIFFSVSGKLLKQEVKESQVSTNISTHRNTGNVVANNMNHMTGILE